MTQRQKLHNVLSNQSVRHVKDRINKAHVCAKYKSKGWSKGECQSTQKGWEHQTRPYVFIRHESCHPQVDGAAIPALAVPGVICTAPRMQLTPDAGERHGG